MQRLSLFAVLVACLIAPLTDAKLRGISNGVFDMLKQRATNPVLRPDIRGKTVRELSAIKGAELPEKKGAVPSRKNGVIKKRALQEGRKLEFFSVSIRSIVRTVVTGMVFSSLLFVVQVYDEFGPSVVNLGETAGLNGLVYNISSYATGQLAEEDVIGALKATCSVVGSKDEHFCTFEVLIAEENGESFGSIISSGALEYKPGGGGYLIIEAAGDAYKDFRGGILTIQYQTIGEMTIVMMELTLS